MFFQWRQSRYGPEKFHSAVVGHAGPGTAGFQAVQQLGLELQVALAPAVESTSGDGKDASERDACDPSQDAQGDQACTGSCNAGVGMEHGIAGSKLISECAIAFDWNSRWASETPGKPREKLGLPSLIHDYHRTLYDANIPVDFVPMVPPGWVSSACGDVTNSCWTKLLQLWRQYRWVVVPAMYSLP
eukprot:SAG31_NODE_5123_length_2727_cov_1.896119_1_plen_186_part_10